MPLQTQLTAKMFVSDTTIIVGVVMKVDTSMYMRAKRHHDRIFIILLQAIFYLANGSQDHFQPSPAVWRAGIF